MSLDLRVVPHFSSGIVERATRERGWKSPHAGAHNMLWAPAPREKRRHAACRLFSRGVIFTRARGTTRSLLCHRLFL